MIPEMRPRAMLCDCSTVDESVTNKVTIIPAMMVCLLVLKWCAIAEPVSEPIRSFLSPLIVELCKGLDVWPVTLYR